MKKIRWFAILVAIFSVVLLFGCRYMTESAETHSHAASYTGELYVGSIDSIYNDGTYYLYKADLTVIDEDLADESSVWVYVNSAVDNTALYLSLVGNGTGKFTGSLFITTSAELSTDASLRRILCTDFSSFSISYHDANPEATVTKTFGSGAVNSDTITLLETTYTTYSELSSAMGVTLYDPDNTDDYATIHVYSDYGDSTGIDVELYTTGVSGYYTGSFYIATVTSSSASTIGVVIGTDYIHVYYDDPSNYNRYFSDTLTVTMIEGGL